MSAHTTDSPRSAAGSQALAALRSAYAAIWRHLSDTMVQVQIARMHGVLAEMSDNELDQIGVRRSELRQYAERLVTGKD